MHINGRALEIAVAEFEERRRRAANIIIYDFAESVHLGNAVQAAEDDLSRIRVELNKLQPEFSALVRRASRLGKVVEGRRRPVKVVFENPSAATNVLIANRSAQPQVLSANSDRTPTERRYLKEVREELNRRIKAGEPDLTIRYLSGIPTIVNKDTLSHTVRSQSKNGQL